MQDIVILGQLGPFTLTAYALCLLCGAAAAVLLTVLLSRKTLGLDVSLSLSLCAMGGALIGARLLYCVLQLEYILVDLGGVGFLMQPWQGGYTMYGALFGGIISIVLYAHFAHRPWPTLLDHAAPGAALAIMVGRLGEYFTSQGLGHFVETEALQHFPFAAYTSEYESWQLPVFVYEAFAALIVMLVCLHLLRKGKAGRTAEVFCALISLCQILLESLRADEFIRFGFVKFNMLAAALMLAVLLTLSLRRTLAQHGWNRYQVVRLVLFVLAAVVVILIEFALDKSPIDNRLLYAVMAATLVVMGVSVLRKDKAA